MKTALLPKITQLLLLLLIGESIAGPGGLDGGRQASLQEKACAASPEKRLASDACSITHSLFVSHTLTTGL